MTTITTRTVYGSALQTTQFAGLAFNMLPNTTLNEKFSVQSGVTPPNNKIPTVGYLAIGNGGHTVQTGSGGLPLIKPIQHVATDGALYNHLPFVLRATNNDISPTERAKYGLRKTVTYGGVQYIAYYLKRLVLDSAVVDISLQTINNGVTTTTEFVPSSGNLSPTPPVLDSQGSNSLTSQYGVVSATLPITFTADECTELINAATIVYGSPDYAIISEMALVSGVDKTVTITGGASFLEVVAAQCAAFINAFHVIEYTATGLSGNYGLGTNEPLLILA
jgi:hypothetical protein